MQQCDKCGRYVDENAPDEENLYCVSCARFLCERCAEEWHDSKVLCGDICDECHREREDRKKEIESDDECEFELDDQDKACCGSGDLFESIAGALGARV